MKTKEQLLTVKQAADKTGLSTYTVRFYTDKGLIPTIKRNNNNQRQYDYIALEWLLVCKYLRQTGMSIKQLQQYVHLCLVGKETVPTRYQMLVKQQQKLVDKIKADQKQMDFLKFKLNAYQKLMHSDQDEDIFNPNNYYFKIK
ncbi:putative HTH-type transcriptional regulator [Philodulcilactobacillus myokoensis]|uniref:HTH-type transcriptional regulator n=1 Tax=Philodulcilactobacillus myokoensis TaxID=2929573 RepID=A0A9W6ES26_9LACO|nr:MerR family transcriptional regulator [Philodulcilactobacillus myokoensis]GLB46147.1 putative HTH-type transcriptional regulator [Philodulcilactobacillus myokoensis]